MLQPITQLKKRLSKPPMQNYNDLKCTQKYVKGTDSLPQERTAGKEHNSTAQEEQGDNLSQGVRIA